MAPDALEIPAIHPLLRATTVLAWASFGLFVIGLALRFPSAGHTFGYVLGAGCLWLALYWWRVPDVLLRLTPDGIAYVDGSLGAFFRFPLRHAGWADVVQVDTRPVVSRYGRYLCTRVTVRDAEDATRLRRITVTSRHDGYTRFLDALAAHVSESTVAMSGPGVQSARVHHELRQVLGGQLQLIGAFVLAGIVLLLGTWFSRR